MEKVMNESKLLNTKLFFLPAEPEYGVSEAWEESLAEFLAISLKKAGKITEKQLKFPLEFDTI